MNDKNNKTISAVVFDMGGTGTNKEYCKELLSK